MLRWRLTLGVLFVALLAGLCWLDAHSARPGIWLMPLALLVAGLGADEVGSLAMARGLPVCRWTGCLGSLLIVLASYVPLLAPEWTAIGNPLLALSMGLVIAIVREMSIYEQPGEVLARLSVAMLTMVYVGVLMSFVVQLRNVAAGDLGLVALVSLIAVVKMCDIGAYTVGRLIGRHKMSPTLSPGKTWEGAAGGIAFACLGAYVTFMWWLPKLGEPAAASKSPAWGWLVFGVVIGVLGMIGDLAESLMKRDAGRKDSSTWMPGFGGVLDLLDSILFAAPAAYALWAIGLVGR